MSKSTRVTWRLVALGVVPIALVTGLIAFNPQGTALSLLIRWAGTLGYVATFLAILSSAYMRELYRFFGRPFLSVHHALSIAGLVLVTLHPIGLAIETTDLAVFVPRVDSWEVFFELGGRPALYLMWIAALVAVYRRTWRKSWRTIHYLNYVAFLLGTVHALKIGTDFTYPLVRVLAVAMAVVVVAVFVRKRFGRRRAKRTSAR